MGAGEEAVLDMFDSLVKSRQEIKKLKTGLRKAIKFIGGAKLDPDAQAMLDSLKALVKRKRRKK
jgi:hypothetical protein